MIDVADDVEDARLLELAADLRRILCRMRRRLREQASIGDLTPSQAAAMVALEKGPATVTELADAQGVRPQSMGAIVAALEAAGVVAGKADPSDGRKTIWSLTEDARSRVAATRAVRADWLVRTIRRELDGQEQEQLAAAIAVLNKLVEA